MGVPVGGIVSVAVGAVVLVGEIIGVSVGVAVGVGVSVSTGGRVAVGVGVSTGLIVAVGEGVMVGVIEGVSVGELVGVMVGVDVGMRHVSDVLAVALWEPPGKSTFTVLVILMLHDDVACGRFIFTAITIPAALYAGMSAKPLKPFDGDIMPGDLVILILSV